MCGIVGALSWKKDHATDSALVRTMLGAIRHRGPDQFGEYHFAGDGCQVSLGSARLSILDLDHGQQPIGNEDRSLWIVFNGEVFNYVELRSELQALGHRFETVTDTEVVLHAYEQFGPACLDLFNGQFALAIWDEADQSLFLARDRLGVRPLCYAQPAGGFVFASEAKALFAHPHLAAEIDPLALAEVFGFWAPRAPRTAFRRVFSIPPGHWLRVDRRGGVTLDRYWQLAFPRRGAEPVTALPQAAGELRTNLHRAVSLRLRADVPVGAYLSGGLDSAAITALIRQCDASPLETFSIAFENQDFDEREYQQAMARHLGTRHHVLSCSDAELGKIFPQVVWHAEVPLTRTAPAPLFLLSKLVHDQGFKVVLTGEGADEFLAGYNIFKEAKVRRFWARRPGSLWRPALLRRLYGYVPDLASSQEAYVRQFFAHRLEDTSHPAYSHQVRWRNNGRTKRLFSADLRAAIASAGEEVDSSMPPVEGLRLPDEFAAWSPLAQAQYLEATTFLPDYLLSSQGDRMAMAHSVEGRFPFLDPQVVAFCSGLAPRLKLCGLREKHVLRQAVRDLLPQEIWARPKRPYRAPIASTFFPNGKPLDWVGEMLAPASIRSAGFFNPQGIAHLSEKIARLGALSETDEMALTGILSTQLLHETFVVRRPVLQPLLKTHDIKTVKRRLGLFSQPTEGN